jgi:hypothetical protein
MVTLKIVDLDVWGNAEDGFEVNNFFNLGEITFPRKSDPYTISKRSIKSKLVKEGFILSTATRKIELDDFSSMDFFYRVIERKTGKPLFDIEVA